MIRKPEFGTLCLQDDDGVVHVYRIASADYCVYEQGDHYWASLLIEAKEKLQPDKDSDEPFLEINLAFREDPTSQLRPGRSFQVESYDDELFNLANLYWGSHRYFDGELRVEACGDDSLTVLIAGDSVGDPLAAHAELRWNPELRRGLT